MVHMRSHGKAWEMSHAISQPGDPLKGHFCHGAIGSYKLRSLSAILAASLLRASCITWMATSSLQTCDSAVSGMHDSGSPL